VFHPHLTSQLASQHAAELRASGDRARRHHIAAGPRNPVRHNSVRHRSVRHRSVRHRAGWTLVEIGLRLAGASDAH
jgi:hypothetical protein